MFGNPGVQVPSSIDEGMGVELLFDDTDLVREFSMLTNEHPPIASIGRQRDDLC